MNRLFSEIDKFDKWAQSYSDIPQDMRGGEWECDYDCWTDIYIEFEDFLKLSNSNEWSNEIIEKLIYIIARDNETEILVAILSQYEEATILITNQAIKTGMVDTKWQLSTILHKLQDKEIAISLLEKLLIDEEEYVNRRALIELARLKSDKVELYCYKFWNKTK